MKNPHKLFLCALSLLTPCALTAASDFVPLEDDAPASPPPPKTEVSSQVSETPQTTTRRARKSSAKRAETTNRENSTQNSTASGFSLENDPNAYIKLTPGIYHVSYESGALLKSATEVGASIEFGWRWARSSFGSGYSSFEVGYYGASGSGLIKSTYAVPVLGNVGYEFGSEELRGRVGVSLGATTFGGEANGGYSGGYWYYGKYTQVAASFGANLAVSYNFAHNWFAGIDFKILANTAHPFTKNGSEYTSLAEHVTVAIGWRY